MNGMNIKNTILQIIFIIIFTFFLQYPVSAQAPAQPAANGAFSIPGVTCGNSAAQDSAGKLCCKKQVIFGEHWGLADGIVKVTEVLKSNAQIQFLLGWILDPINNLRETTLQLDRTTTPIACPLGFPSTLDPNDPNCTCLDSITPAPINKLKEICTKYFKNSPEIGNCQSCADASGVWTGLGCIYGDTGRFIRETIFGFAIGLAGVIALICIIYAIFTLQISRGNPEKLKKAQELLTSCIMGLMLILFSVFILRLIGVNILKIPGFS